ncbi:DctP family TRAP transporter solute-binding subunit [Hydrogenibacillus sp. N12]|uniref:DctP family TRAP transporter solute-binding subunit n=1 Tax=Hydrogenibacillus sp. N12 TaxID=2866627 RepID=UPI001C7CAE20|nr:DctP family TRAP transporter solute-binding subunit [Hydrogenibacillus sp. N12]QZA32407.1 DctP family TRAP transporter solute-binding subunit [Hydrogenibacillus sp. N12]
MRLRTLATGAAFVLVPLTLTVFLLIFLGRIDPAGALDRDPEQEGLEAILTLRMSHVVAENTPKGQAARYFARRAAELSGGRIRVEVFPNGALFSDISELDALRRGDVDLIAPAASNWTDRYIEWQVLDLPFIFRDLDDLNAVLNGPLGTLLKEAPERDGLRTLLFWHSGLKQITTNVRPVLLPEDFRGLVFRRMQSSTIARYLELLGARTVPAPFNQTFPLLEKGMVNSEENTLTNIYSKKFYTVQTDLTLSDHGYLGYPVLVNDAFWRRLSPDDRAILLKALEEAGAYELRLIRELEARALKEMAASGLRIHRLTADERTAWEQAVAPLYDEVAVRMPPPLRAFVEARKPR